MFSHQEKNQCSQNRKPSVQKERGAETEKEAANQLMTMTIRQLVVVAFIYIVQLNADCLQLIITQMSRGDSRRCLWSFVTLLDLVKLEAVREWPELVWITAKLLKLLLVNP